MNFYRHFLEENVVEAAKRRFRHIFEHYDNVIIMFSGGKDSLVCVELARRVMIEEGIPFPLKIVFKDQELIPSAVLDFVREYMLKDWTELHWFATPMSGTNSILGKAHKTIWWDPRREWVREKPPWARTDHKFPATNPPSQRKLDAWFYDALDLKGSACFVTGVRTQESITRYYSVVRKLSLPFIASSSVSHVKLGKPIYDWQENDVFAWFEREGIPYCPWYDAQLLTGVGLRVATAMHPCQVKRNESLQQRDPDFYEAILRVFPDIALNKRYFNEYDLEAGIKPYLGKGMAGVYAWIARTYTGAKRQQAMSTARMYGTAHRNSPEAYPSDHLLKHLARGKLWQQPMPLPKIHTQRKK